LKKEGEGRYNRKMIKRRKHFPNVSKIEELARRAWKYED